MAESEEIHTFDDLRRLRLADEGYLVITDSVRPAIIHRINAKCVSIDSFNLKVAINKGKQGGYFWVDSIATAARLYEAKRCKVCKPPLLLVPPSTFGG